MDFDKETVELSYQSNITKFNLKYEGDFLIDGKMENINYNRYNSSYIKSRKKDKTIIFKFNGKSLFLNFANLKRSFN